GHRTELAELLADAAAPVSRAAADALRPCAPAVPQGTLLAALEPGRPPHVRRNALRIVDRLGKWDRLLHLLRLCRDADQPLARAPQAGLRGWVPGFNRPPQLPDAETAREASARLAEAAEVLPAELVAELASILRSRAGLESGSR